ncbi:MFS transporter [Streptomyces sp. NPDC056634]|uniref:MFS transporter n=1 Tax=Streptomyces sp. NPDC056634 TaxID=3345885 RepID=UPI0036763749
MTASPGSPGAVAAPSAGGTTSPDSSTNSRAGWLITLYAGGGEFCDGYILSIIGVALPLVTSAFQLGPGGAGLIGSASLVGMFAGGLAFGYVTDRIGRRKVYLAAIAAFIVLSALQYGADAAWQLVVLRFLMGVAIGADFAIAGTIAAEFAPERSRGPLMVVLVTMWSAGAAVAYAVGWLMLRGGLDDWRLLLASSAVPAAVVLLLRLRTPESPQWLLSQGRVEEARAVLRRMGGDIGTLVAPVRPAVTPRYSDIFRNGYGRRTLFVCLFWCCQLLPIYAITTYEPTILASFGLGEGTDSYLGAVAVQLFFVLGSLSGMLMVNRGRRALLLWSFGASVLPLAGLAAVADPPGWLVVLLFAVFGVTAFASQCLQALYPSELFPTEVRATANGFAAGVSRIGAAIGTFGAPVLLGHSTRLAMLVGAGIAAAGWLATLLLAPETRGLSLDEAAASDEPNSSLNPPVRSLATPTGTAASAASAPSTSSTHPTSSASSTEVTDLI